MSETVEFFEPMKLPTKTHNELMPVKRGEGLSTIKTPELLDVEADWEAHLGRHVPEAPIDGAVSVKMTLLYGLPDGKEQFEPKTTKTRRRQRGEDCLRRHGKARLFHERRPRGEFADHEGMG